jgi:hypothetical protein
MAHLLVFRLVPQKPVSATDFQQYLSDGTNVLIIEAYDVSFAQLTEPLALLGRASFVPDAQAVGDNGHAPTQPQPIPGFGTTIAQHRKQVQGNSLPPPNQGENDFTYELQSIATAGVVITPPNPEYDRPDVVVKVKWGSAADPTNAKLISTFTVDYNEATYEAADPFPPTDHNLAGNPFFLVDLFQNQLGMTNVQSDSVAAYIPLVDPRTLSFTDHATVTVPKDGSPPNFAELLAAINKVTQGTITNPGDPGNLSNPSNLTPAQARHVAFEIVWNRHLDPLPRPPSVEALADMYTVPPATTSNGVDADNNRAKFEGALAAYQGTNDATAEAMVKYVFSVSAALAAQQMSADARPVRFQFPVQPDVAPVGGGKIKQTAVALDNP